MLDIDTIDRYRTYLTDVRNASVNTAASYIYDTKQFSAYLCNLGYTGFTEVTEDSIRQYLSDIAQSGHSSSTVSRCLVSLRAFFSFLINEGLLEVSPAADITHPARKRGELRLMNDEEIRRLFELLDGPDALSRRDKAMLETLYATGIRVSELIALDKSDVNLATGLITCRYGKTRDIPLYARASKAISAYLSLAREELATPFERALFVNARGLRMTRQGFWKILKNYADEAQIDSYISPQTLRNSFAVHLLENGADLRSLQEMLGHADISSTQVIARAVKRQLKEVYNKTHPRA